MKQFFLAIAMSTTALQAQTITEMNHPVSRLYNQNEDEFK